MPWFLTKHLQDKFDSKPFVSDYDDEKFLYGNKSMEEINKNVLRIFLTLLQ